MLSFTKALRGSATLSIFAMTASNALAQTPGEWRYSIVTDQSTIPADMQVNFPAITFSACRSAEDFASGRAFALQTLASSAERCPSSGFVRTPESDGRGDALTFVYACDAGQTLRHRQRSRSGDPVYGQPGISLCPSCRWRERRTANDERDAQRPLQGRTGQRFDEGELVHVACPRSL